AVQPRRSLRRWVECLCSLSPRRGDLEPALRVLKGVRGYGFPALEIITALIAWAADWHKSFFPDQDSKTGICKMPEKPRKCRNHVRHRFAKRRPERDLGPAPP